MKSCIFFILYVLFILLLTTCKGKKKEINLTFYLKYYLERILLNIKLVSEEPHFSFIFIQLKNQLICNTVTIYNTYIVILLQYIIKISTLF